MNFFEKQDQYKRNSRRFIALFAAGLIILTFVLYVLVLLFVYRPYHPESPWRWWHPTWFVYTLLGTLMVVGIASLVKHIQLGKGGHSIAQMMGGEKIPLNTSDFYEKRALNVVAEMALASGVPVPDVYLLRQENAINAFAAGMDLDNAVIGLTRGTIERLSRDELQGVVGHEFSHILHGDMRINLRMISLLHGILFIHILGRLLIHGSFSSSTTRRSRRGHGKKGGNAVMLGLGLWVVGYLGFLIGKVIQSSIARQREYLADSSSVQYTRNPNGIAGALKKIGGFYDDRTARSYLYHHNSEEISHMTFAPESFPMFHLPFLESHPPIVKRIQAIEPQWMPPEMSAEEKFLSHDNLGQMNTQEREVLFGQSPSAPMEGGFGPQLGQFASLPLPIVLAEKEDWAPIWSKLRQMTQHPQKAKLLLLYLVTTPTSDALQTTRELLAHADPYSLHLWDDLQHWIPKEVSAHRIEIFDLCMPALRKLPLSEYKAWLRLMMNAVKADNIISLHEWLLIKMIRIHLHHHHYPRQKAQGAKDLDSIKQEIRVLGSAVAHAGEEDTRLAALAFRQGMEVLGWADMAIMQPEALKMDDIDQAHDVLENAARPVRIQFIQACKKIIQRDQKVSWEEYELFRALSDSLGQPVQP
jgi:Zn-dependent protease with chaperone function